MLELNNIPHFSEEDEELLVQFDESWNHPEIETLRSRCPSGASDAYVLELIRIDIQKRKEHRLATDQERYLTTFPELQKQATLRESIAHLLDESHSQAQSAFSVSKAGPKAAASRSHGNEQNVERYHLLSKLGEGGMGEVWTARQEEPVRRTVALKLIKRGMDSQAMLLRFEQERQALARMDHVNINKVLDAGVMRDGRPFFVMEYVEGEHLLAFCETARLSVRDRLELFISICKGVQHAHQKGIVHRDLKPANILVVVSDNKAVPKIIDFGVAKAMGDKLTRETVVTQVGSMIGTLEYMAPEQLAFDSNDVDTRTDIYALGAILYELLTGVRPLEQGKLKNTAFDGILRMIREDQPMRPSLRMAQARASSSEPPDKPQDDRWKEVLRGELDWIVMKCLEKEKERRYDTVDNLARDISRYLSHEVIEARPPSAYYQAQLFIRRNKGRVILASALLFALIAGSIGTTWGFISARQQRNAAVYAQNQSEKRLTQIEKANDILSSIFVNLDPELEEKEGKSLKVLLGEQLGQAVKHLDSEAVGDAITVGKMQSKLGTTLIALGHLKQAQEVLEKACPTLEMNLGAEHADTLEAKSSLSCLYLDQAKYEQAQPLLQDLVRIRERVMGPDVLETLNSKNDLALLYKAKGQYDLALPLYEQAFQGYIKLYGPDHAYSLVCQNNLAIVYNTLGMTKEMEATLLSIIDKQSRSSKLGPDHPSTLVTRHNLAGLYSANGRYAEAESLFLQVLEAKRKNLGVNHLDTLKSKYNLSMLYFKKEDYQKGQTLTEELLASCKAHLPSGHPLTLNCQVNQAFLLARANKPEESEKLFQATIQLQSEKLGRNNNDTVTSKQRLAQMYQEQKRFADAERVLLDVHESLVQSKGIPQTNMSKNVKAIVNLYEQWGKTDRANEWKQKLSMP